MWQVLINVVAHLTLLAFHLSAAAFRALATGNARHPAAAGARALMVFMIALSRSLHESKVRADWGCVSAAHGRLDGIRDTVLWMVEQDVLLLA